MKKSQKIVRVVVALVDRNISVLKRLKNVTTKIGAEQIAITSKVNILVIEREKNK